MVSSPGMISKRYLPAYLKMLMLLKGSSDYAAQTKGFFYSFDLKDMHKKMPTVWSKSCLQEMIGNKIFGDLPDPKYSLVWIEYSAPAEELIQRKFEAYANMTTMSTLRHPSGQPLLSPQIHKFDIQTKASLVLEEGPDPLCSPECTPISRQFYGRSPKRIVKLKGLEKESSGSPKFRISSLQKHPIVGNPFNDSYEQANRTIDSLVGKTSPQFKLNNFSRGVENSKNVTNSFIQGNQLKSSEVSAPSEPFRLNKGKRRSLSFSKPRPKFL